MASYLTTASIGEFDIKAYKADGIKYWDAIDPDLFDAARAAHRRRFALSQSANSSYKRLARTINVPAGGGEAVVLGQPQHRAQLGLLLRRGAHRRRRTTGRRCPTSTATRPRTRASPARSGSLHPFLEHYQTENADGGCDPQGTTGAWNAISGASDGYEQWAVDLDAVRGQARRALAQLRQRRHLQLRRRVRRRHRRSRRAGLDVVRERRQPLDGWTDAGRARGQRPERERLVRRRPRPTRPSRGRGRARTLARQPEIIRFLAGIFGPYPFSSAGAIVDDCRGLGFALENQTRPVYARGLFEDRADEPARLGRRARARAPVDRRRPRAGRLAAHLAQRGLRDLQRVAVERARGPRHGAGDLRRSRVDPGRRPVLGAGDRRPGPGRAVRRRGLRPRRDDAARAAAEDRRRRVLPAAARVGAGERAAATSRSRSSSRWPSGSRARTSKPFFDEWLFTPAKPASLGGGVAARSAPQSAAPARVRKR